jgi:cyclophilin family peptidyl-prolyl cis-trans isomerase
LPGVRRFVLTAVLALGLAACGSSANSSSSSTPAASPSTSSSTPAASANTGACLRVAVPAPKGPQHLAAPKLRLDPAKTYTVTVATNCGTFAFTLDVKQAPKTSASFYSLVKRGFFDGLTFHRVVAGFVIQGGDPLGNGTGGPGYSVVETPPSNLQYAIGDVAMAKTQNDPRGASGSQFFVVTGSASGLTPDYALVGKVVSGMSVIRRIGALPTNPAGDGAPTPTVVMSRVTVSVS